jgi:tetratricopeptide (TPR) repeat protein
MRFLLLPVLALAAQAESNWMRLVSPNFELYTDTNVEQGRETLKRFEQIRHIFLVRSRTNTAPPLPIRVYLFRHRADYDRYARPGSAGFYQAAADRDHIAIAAGVLEGYRAVFHEYAHLVMRHMNKPLPLWWNEGTAEFFSTLTAKGSAVKVGLVIPAHVANLRQTKLLDLPTLLAADQTSSYYNEQKKMGIFYAQSWALVHMLNLHAHYRPSLLKFLDEVLTGTATDAAFQTAFGKSLDAVAKDLRTYIESKAFYVATITVDPPAELDAITPEALPDPAAELALLDMLNANPARRLAAEGALRRILAAHPDSGEAHARMGQIEADRRNNTAARKHFEQAFAAGFKSASAHHEYARLLRAGKEPVERVVEHLRASAELNARGVMVWYDLAQALHESGDTPAALSVARKARELSRTHQEIRNSEGLIEWLEGTMQAATQSGPRVHVAATPEPQHIEEAAPPRLVRRQRPESEIHEKVAESMLPPRGDAYVDGILRRLDCLDKGARFHVASGATTVKLFVDDPGRVTLRNASGISMELSCGALKPAAVRIEYIQKPDAKLGTAGVISAIEFK